jgi:membrane protein implicated in regulation of membrane protease activity
VAIVGALMVHHWHAAHRNADQGHSNFLDRGQPVVLEGWVDENAGIARVKYRGAWWDARLSRAEHKPAPGTTLYIEGQEGNTLVVAPTPPSRWPNNE